MSKLLKILLALSLCLLTFSSAFAEEQGKQPYAELIEVFQNLQDNHLSKPSEPQLVQGALKNVAQQMKQAAKSTVSIADSDDTVGELQSRLTQWQAGSHLPEKTLYGWAIDGMLKTLDDPHTMFFSREQLRRFQESVENQYVGFGFRMRKQGEKLFIREIVPKTPAAASGLEKGDQLLAVDGLDLSGKSLEEAFALLKGEAGSQADLTVIKAKLNQKKQITMKRAYLSIPEAEGQAFNGNIAYISLETFGSDAATQFRDLLAQYSGSKQPLKGLVLDLRDNGGGYLTSARDIASLFMEDGLLMYTTNRNGVEVETWVHNGRDVSYPVRILVNEGTASASELLSGALRDHGIAKLVGTKTYGKGSAQQIVPLMDGDALKITLHEYFTPNHTVVNHVGLQPDIAAEDYLAQVIEALKSLGVKHFELREIGDEVIINGASFISLDPMFKQESNALSIRSEVLASLQGDKSLNQKGYTSLEPFLTKEKSFTLRKDANGTVLSYTIK